MAKTKAATSDRKQNKRVRTGDKVVVIAGNEQGKTGVVLSRTDNRVVVQGVNVRKKAVRRSQLNQQGGIVELEMPIHASNVAIASEEDKPVRLKVRTDAEGSRELYYKQGSEETAYRPVMKAK